MYFLHFCRLSLSYHYCQQPDQPADNYTKELKYFTACEEVITYKFNLLHKQRHNKLNSERKKNLNKHNTF